MQHLFFINASEFGGFLLRQVSDRRCDHQLHAVLRLQAVSPRG